MRARGANEEKASRPGLSLVAEDVECNVDSVWAVCQNTAHNIHRVRSTHTAKPPKSGGVIDIFGATVCPVFFVRRRSVL